MTDIKAATVLTDERILAALGSITHEAPKRLPPGWLKFARAIEREVLAHAGVTAEPASHTQTAETEISDRLRHIVTNRGEGPIAVTSKLLLQAADECDRFYNGMLAWKKTAEKKDRDWQNERMGRVDDRVASRLAAHVPAAEVRAALEMARSYIDATSTEPGYGFARPDNPHDFHPDAESCSADEIAAHKAACDAYDKGEYTPERGSEWIGAMHILRAPWGIGTYIMRDEQAVKVLAAIDSSLAQQSTADKASEVRAEWIAVGTKWPSNHQNVWVTHETKYTNAPITYSVMEAVYVNGWWRDARSDNLLSPPTHWMPLNRPLPAAPSTADSANTGALGEKGAE